jgi:hypothetical protein
MNGQRAALPIHLQAHHLSIALVAIESKQLMQLLA